MLPIYVVNNYGQFNHLILRMLRDLDIEARMIPNTTPPENVAGGCRGLILGGGPTLSRAGNAEAYLALGLPVLGICLGLHIIATRFGGRVTPGHAGGYGPIEVDIVERDDILAGYADRIKVWASHADEVSRIPEGFICLARSAICGTEAISFSKKHMYGLQWHPEVSHTFEGKRVFENFDRITRENHK